MYQVNQTYKTKFATGEEFLLKEILYSGAKIIGFQGIYPNRPHLGVCPLGADRLIDLDEIKISAAGETLKDIKSAKELINKKHPNLVKNWGESAQLLSFNQIITLMEEYKNGK